MPILSLSSRDLADGDSGKIEHVRPVCTVGDFFRLVSSSRRQILVAHWICCGVVTYNRIFLRGCGGAHPGREIAQRLGSCWLSTIVATALYRHYYLTPR